MGKFRVSTFSFSCPFCTYSSISAQLLFPTFCFLFPVSGAFPCITSFLFPCLLVVHSLKYNDWSHLPGMACFPSLPLPSRLCSQPRLTFVCGRPCPQPVIVGTPNSKNEERLECSCCPAADSSVTLRKPVVSLDVRFLFYKLGCIHSIKAEFVGGQLPVCLAA